MRFNHPVLTLAASLLFMLLFVLSISLVQSPWADADDGLLATVQSNANVPQDQDKDQDKDEDEEEDEDEGEEEEEEWDEEEGYHDEDGDEREHRRRQDDGDDEEEWDEEEERERRHEEMDEWGEEAEHFAREHEFEMRELEGSLGRLEIVHRLAEVADNKTATASYAIMQMHEVFDDEEEAVEFLNVMVRSDKVSLAVKNLLKMKLVEVLGGMERQDEAREILKSMILN